MQATIHSTIGSFHMCPFRKKHPPPISDPMPPSSFVLQQIVVVHCIMEGESQEAGSFPQIFFCEKQGGHPFFKRCLSSTACQVGIDSRKWRRDFGAAIFARAIAELPSIFAFFCAYEIALT